MVLCPYLTKQEVLFVAICVALGQYAMYVRGMDNGIISMKKE